MPLRKPYFPNRELINVYVHKGGQTTHGDRVDAAWLDPSSDVTLWVDLAAPTQDELRVLSDVFHFHRLTTWLEIDPASLLHQSEALVINGYFMS